ncbi:MAG: motility protein A [Spirochaetaceae bacterium]|jgi:chemotaxis protein MotA|nr:motility protein A [Spirochaetaceae bacterium]
MDLATIIGVAGGAVALVFCVISSGGALSGIWDPPSFVFVIVGSWLALFNSGSLNAILGMTKNMSRAFKSFDYGEKTIIQNLVSLAEKARREGILALEEGLDDLNDEFMKSGIRLVVDGIDGAQVRAIMENDMSQTESRHVDMLSRLNYWGSIGPGYGMMGTVIGLIGMLRNLEDKSSLGPNMAVALVTTLYGSLMVNWIIGPFSKKLGAQNASEMAVKEVIIEGVLSIQAGDNPRILAQKLLTYLDPATRRKIGSEITGD